MPRVSPAIVVAAALVACGDSGRTDGDGGPGKPGALVVRVGQNACPTIERFVVSPASVAVGGPIGVDAAALDDNNESVTFLWSATAGRFRDANAANTTYVCAVAGKQTVTLTVSDGQCAREASVEVACGVP